MSYIKIYLYRFDIKLCKFINKFVRYQIIFYNLSIIQIVRFVVKIIYVFYNIKFDASIFISI